MKYIDEIREKTKRSLENEKEERLALALHEIEECAKKGYYSTAFYYHRTEVLDFIADYLVKEGFSIHKNYKTFIMTDFPDYFTPFIKIEWKD